MAAWSQILNVLLGKCYSVHHTLDPPRSKLPITRSLIELTFESLEVATVAVNSPHALVSHNNHNHIICVLFRHGRTVWVVSLKLQNPNKGIWGLPSVVRVQ